MVSDVMVIGGGASGLVAAIVAARAGKIVTILEHKDKIGKKILATGNGKCNYTNLELTPNCYRGEDTSYAWKVLNQFGVEDTIRFFKELGIYPKNKNGYLYPYSEQATSILDVLRLELEHLKVEILCNEHVNRIDILSETKGKISDVQKAHSENRIYRIHTESHFFDASQIILATGGMSSSDLGSDGSGYKLAKLFGHHIIPPVPALVQLQSKETYFKVLAGIRVQAYIKLSVDECIEAESQGELQLTNYGVSGIPVFEISRYAARAFNVKRKVSLSIDFLPDLDVKELYLIIEERIISCGYKSVEELFIGLLNKKLSNVIIKEEKINPNKISSNLEKREINQLVKRIKTFNVPISATNPFTNAQVSAGGVNTNEVDSQTMESNYAKGLYVVGELLDIDGTCGGYNLQWAWSTGYLAGRSAAACNVF